MKKNLKVFLFFVTIGMVVLFCSGPRPSVERTSQQGDLLAQPVVPSLDKMEDFLRDRDLQVPLKDPVVASRLRWFGTPGVQTAVSIVYLHGFSSSPLDLHPVLDMVAESLGANLLEYRLTGHGLDVDARDPRALGSATVNDWIQDTESARALGTLLGKKTLLVGMSTGGSLAVLSALSRPQEDLLGLALLSPNFEIANPLSKVVTFPWGVALASLITGGRVHSWTPENPLRDTLWTSSYLIDAAAQVQALVEETRHSDFSQLKIPVLMVHSNQDEVVSIDAMKQKFTEVGTEVKGIAELPGSTRHELAGNAIAPELSSVLADTISAFFINVTRSVP